VPYGAAARWILVPASFAGGGTGVAVIDPSAGGVRLQPTPSSAGGPEYTLHLAEAPVAHLLGDDRVVTGLYQLTLAGAASLADGALAGALALTTAHVGSRKQFGRPLATFQAVAQQVADVARGDRGRRDRRRRDRGRVPDPARRARVGAGRSRRPAPLVGQAVPVRGTAVPGLYAAGRSAAGLCSSSYVSGLSLADCVFSGRRAGRHAAAAVPDADQRR